MSTPTPLDPPPWGFLEWVITSLVGVVLAVTGYMMRNSSNITNHEVKISHHEAVLETVLEDVKEVKEKLSIRPTHEDIGKLIFNMQTILEARLDQVSNRLSRIDERIDSILTRKN